LPLEVGDLHHTRRTVVQLFTMGPSPPQPHPAVALSHPHVRIAPPPTPYLPAPCPKLSAPFPQRHTRIAYNKNPDNNSSTSKCTMRRCMSIQMHMMCAVLVAAGTVACGTGGPSLPPAPGGQRSHRALPGLHLPARQRADTGLHKASQQPVGRGAC
jgi:hypothetical protein